MSDTAKLNNIVLEALQSRGYSYTEANYLVKQLINNSIKTTKKKKGVKYHRHNKNQKIDIFT
jgi:hypothetical protein